MRMCSAAYATAAARPGGEIQLRKYARDVPTDGVFAEDEPVGHVLVAHPRHHRAEDFYFASAQAGRVGCLAGLFAGLGFHSTQQRGGAPAFTFPPKFSKTTSAARTSASTTSGSGSLRVCASSGRAVSNGIPSRTNSHSAASRCRFAAGSVLAANA